MYYDEALTIKFVRPAGFSSITAMYHYPNDPRKLFTERWVVDRWNIDDYRVFLYLSNQPPVDVYQSGRPTRSDAWERLQVMLFDEVLWNLSHENMD